MGRAVLTLLCLWSCIMLVAPLTSTEVHRVTEYIKKTFNLTEAKQHAFVAVLTKEECGSLSPNNKNLKILQKEEANKITDALNNGDIYEGSQMVLATFKPKETKKEHNTHSEYRLLFPSPGSTVSPVQNLLNKNSKEACILFYSLNSPCVGVCANTKHGDNIINKLPVFDKFKNRTFAYNLLYSGDINGTKAKREDILAGLREINKKMKVYRCFSASCHECFKKGDIVDGHCGYN